MGKGPEAGVFRAPAEGTAMSKPGRVPPPEAAGMPEQESIASCCSRVPLVEEGRAASGEPEAAVGTPSLVMGTEVAAPGVAPHAFIAA